MIWDWLRKQLGISDISERLQTIEERRIAVVEKKAALRRHTKRNKKWMKMQEDVPLSNDEKRDWEAGL